MMQTRKSNKHGGLTIHQMIAKAITDAQIASDSGKGIDSLTNVKSRGARHCGYDLKVVYIIRAIELINSSKTHFKYYVERRSDQNGYPSIIVYFMASVSKKAIYGYGTGCRESIQISFHTPINLAGDLLPYIGKGTKTHWNHKIGGSRDGAEKLAMAFHLK